MRPEITTLFFSHTRQYVKAELVELAPELAEQKIHCDWWADAGLVAQFDAVPIDRHWNWNEMGMEYDGRVISTQKIAVVPADRAVQGAMMISADAVPSVLNPGAGAVFVELLFTAPRNRPALRLDGKPYFLGVGTALLCWAASFSRSIGCKGRLRLDGSPQYVDWYEK